MWRNATSDAESQPEAVTTTATVTEEKPTTVTETVPIGGFQDTPVGNVVLWDDAATQQLWDSMK